MTDNLKAGVDWPDMHKLAEREILKVLKEHDLIKGDLEDMMRDRLGALFMPHGLGHFIGIDTDFFNDKGLENFRNFSFLIL